LFHPPGKSPPTPKAWGKILAGSTLVGVGVACPFLFPTYIYVLMLAGDELIELTSGCKGAR